MSVRIVSRRDLLAELNGKPRVGLADIRCATPPEPNHRSAAYALARAVGLHPRGVAEAMATLAAYGWELRQIAPTQAERYAATPSPRPSDDECPARGEHRDEWREWSKVR